MDPITQRSANKSVLGCSPVHGLLGTNALPTEPDKARIRDFVSQSETELGHRDSEIERLTAALDALVAEREALSNYVLEHKALLSPIRRLPPELMSDIFLMCLPDFATNSPPTPSVDTAPVLLTQICSLWREIAISTPRLWSIFHACTRTRTVVASFADMWLTRSGSCPLDMVVSCPDGVAAPEKEENFARFMEALIVHCDRWKNVIFVMPEKLSGCLARIPPAGLSSLVSFELRIENQENPGNWSSLRDDLSALQNAPCLRSFGATGINEDPSQLKLPWAQLVELDIDCIDYGWSISINETFTMLKECSRLLVLFMTVDTVGDLTPLHPLVHQNLREIHFSTSINLGPLFDVLSFPLVTSLSIDTLDGDVSQSSFGRAFHGSPPCIEHLYLDDVRMTEHDILHTLASLPSLVTLQAYSSMPSTAWSPRVLKALTYRPWQTCLLPNLKHIELSVCGTYPAATYAGLARSRWAAVAEAESAGANVFANGDPKSAPPVRLEAFNLSAPEKSQRRLRNAIWLQLKQCYEEGLRLPGVPALSSDFWARTRSTSTTT